MQSDARPTQAAAPIPCGRFAPSPTGPLHFGSLVAALGSWLHARASGGRWLVRMEDLDRPRCRPGADALILRALERLGLEWDGTVLYQSTRGDAYRAALAELQRRDALYPCGCTRREISDSALPCQDGPVYPGTCRFGLPPGRHARAWRVRTADTPVDFLDELQGSCSRNLAREVGDFVLLRADGIVAYQLAVVVDDAWQGVNEVVRGADLLDSTPRQIHLQHILTLPTPRYLHLPVALNRDGEKLSKQTFAAPLDDSRPTAELCRALRFMHQRVPPDARDMPVDSLLQWALAHWSTRALPRARSAPVPEE